MAAGPAGPSGEAVEKRLYQKVDVSAYSTAIDNSQLLARASSYFQTEDRPEFEGSDVGGVNLYFLDGQAEVIDGWRSILASPNLAWVHARLEGTVPPGTRAIAFELRGKKTERTFVNAFFDDANLRLRIISQEIEIDLKPRTHSNVVVPDSYQKVWVAILGDEEVDVANIEPSAVRLGPDEAAPRTYRYTNVNDDGFADLKLLFLIRETGIACGDSNVELTAKTVDGSLLYGRDIVKTRGCRHHG